MSCTCWNYHGFKLSLRTTIKTIIGLIVLAYAIWNTRLLKIHSELRGIKSHRSHECDRKTAQRVRAFPRRNFNPPSSDTKSYKGPVVPGWEPQRSRDLKDYLPRNKNIFPILPRNLDTVKTDLIAIIRTRVEAYGGRNRTRCLWGRLLRAMHPGARIIFIIGKLNDKDGIPKTLQKEIDTHGDILQVDFIDSYYNLTLKTVASLRFAVENSWITPPEFIMTMDDDVFLNVPPFLKLLNGFSKDCAHPFLGGSLRTGFSPIQDSNTSQIASKWGVPSYMLLKGGYPAYILGSHTIMSYETAQCIHEEAYNLPFLHIEDAFIGFSAYRCGINPSHVNGIWNMGAPIDELNLISCIPPNQEEAFQKIIHFYNLTDIRLTRGVSLGSTS